MHMAYDTILQCEVNANLAAQNGGAERYRYECICCGEEVSVAASHSKKMVPHFRHHSGNNDVECENYIGQYGAIYTDSRSRRNNRERSEFYFDSNSKTFSLGLRINESEITFYEQHNTVLELRTKDLDTPFCIMKINRTNFTPDVPTLIPLNHFSRSYYLSNTHDGTKRKYDLFHHDSPTFFKISDNDDNPRAKLVHSNVLYTNTQYFVLFQNQYSLPYRFPSGIEIRQTFHFETMNRNFTGMVLVIENKTASINTLLLSWDYQLEASETLTLIWPPSPVINDISIIYSNNAYIFTSFELQAHGNINVHSRNILKVNQDISNVFVESKTKIYKKNAEIVINKLDPPVDCYEVNEQDEEKTNKFKVLDDGHYFLFNNWGCSALEKGQKVIMTPNSSIIKYEHNYPVKFVYPCPQKELDGQALLEDILAHYRRTEAFDITQFNNLDLSEIASKYIDKCKKTGSINSVVKQYIKEGCL